MSNPNPIEQAVDEAAKKHWSEVTDPREALQILNDNSWVFGHDPYYADLEKELWEMVERILKDEQ